MAGPRLSEDQKQEILLAYASGQPIADIAMQWGVNYAYPGLLAKRRGLPLRASGGAREACHNGQMRRQARTHMGCKDAKEGK